MTRGGNAGIRRIAGTRLWLTTVVPAVSDLACFGNQHQALDLVGFESDCHRLTDARENGGVVQFGDKVAVETQPVFDGAGVEVDDLQAALRFGVALLQSFVEIKAVERGVSRPGERHDGIVTSE